MIRNYTNIYTVLIEDGIGNQECIIVDAEREDEAGRIACDYAKVNQYGNGDWEVLSSYKGIDIITQPEVDEAINEHTH